VNTNPTTSDSKTTDGTGEGQFVSTLDGLTAGSTYHVRAYASNSLGTAYGGDLSFTTLGNAPECITQPATDITSSGATLNGTLNANDLPTTVTFEYGTTTSYGSTITSTQSPVTGNTITNVNAIISGLNPGTIYHFRVKTINSLGTTDGGDLTFSTPTSIPTLNTSSISNTTSNSARSGGNITSDGGAIITARGVCWATSPNPTIYNDKSVNGIGTGSFVSNIRCLSSETTYYVRAYATNDVGTAYGDQESFLTEPCPITFNPNLTYGSVSDIDGNCYKTILIGTLTWMAENLRTSRYNDGSQIPNVTGDIEWSELFYTVYDEFEGQVQMGTGAFCWYNNDSAKFENEYGKLYNWVAVNSGKLCPVGWCIPNLEELTRLIEFPEYDIMQYRRGSTLMETGTDHWDESLNVFPEGVVATNSTGFTALPGGLRTSKGEFNGLGRISQFWASDKWWFPDFAYRLIIPYYLIGSPTGASTSVGDGLSIRCVREN